MTSFAARRRLTGATLALLLQCLFVALLVQAMRPDKTPVKLIQELTLVLPRLREAEPVKPPPARTSAPSRTPAMTLPPVLPAVPPSATIAPLPAAPSQEDLRGVGQALFGCAPETWSSLTPQQRSHCTPPSDGVAIQQAPPLLNAPDHVKDKATWEEQWAEDHWMPGPCPAGAIVFNCLLEQVHAEKERAKQARARIAEDKAKALQEPKRPLPERIGVHPQ